MNIEEFEKQVQPSGKRSRLEPFREQIFQLKAKGYADWQVKDWLAANGLEVSRQAVQQFIKKGNRPQGGTTIPKETPASTEERGPDSAIPTQAPEKRIQPVQSKTSEKGNLTPEQVKESLSRKVDLKQFRHKD